MRDGVVDGLTPEARERYAGFFEDCRAVRDAQGLEPLDASRYLELPFGRTESPWPQRARSWRSFERDVLIPLERDATRPLEILDAGAGAGWLSYRLALRGHRPVAIDLRDDPRDALGAVSHYREVLERPFPAIQAEFDNLPLGEDQFDLVVYNSSFHHAVDYRQTLREARRVLSWGGRVVILDTPIYQRFQDGEAMVERRHARFEERYGRRLDSVLSMEYLDEGMLQALAVELGLRWTIHKPWHGLNREAQAWLARWSARRPPARYWILEASWGGS